MQFPYERYETLAEPRTFYYPTGEETLAHRIFQTIEQAGTLLSQLLDQPMPDPSCRSIAIATYRRRARRGEQRLARGACGNIRGGTRRQNTCHRSRLRLVRRYFPRRLPDLRIVARTVRRRPARPLRASDTS